MRLAYGAFLFALGMAASAPAAAQDKTKDPAAIEQAKKHMEAGAAFYNDPSGHKCEEAYKEFKKANELSGSLNALKGMAVCALELERDGEAIAHYEKFVELRGDKIDPADKAQAESDLKALKAAVSWITLGTDRPNTRITDVRVPSKGYPITNRYVIGPGGKKLGMHPPGTHVFTASSEGAPDQEWKIDVANGGAHEHAFAFDKGKPVTAEGFGEAHPSEGAPDSGGPSRPVPTAVFVLGGITAALAIPTVILMVRAKGVRDDYDAANGTLAGPALEDMRSDVTSANLLADIFLGATVVGLTTTGILYFTRPVKSGPSEPSPATARRAFSRPEPSWTVAPTLGTRGPGAFVRGAF